MTPLPPTKSWQEMTPNERDEVVAAFVEGWTPEQGAPKRWSQELLLAQVLTRRILGKPYHTTLFGGLLYKRVYQRAVQLLSETDLGGDLPLEVALAYLEPSDVAWAYLEVHGEAPPYAPATTTKDRETAFLI